jgi:hypothetical protein
MQTHGVGASMMLILFTISNGHAFQGRNFLLSSGTAGVHKNVSVCIDDYNGT